MRKLIEYTLVSADGIWSQPYALDVGRNQDDAYMRDGLGQLEACEAMLMGRNTYEMFAKIYADRSMAHPWAKRMHEIKKYVFSSQLQRVDWHHSELVRSDPTQAVAKLKQEDGGDLLTYGHGILTQTLLAHGLIDVIDVSVYPVLLGEGKPLGINNEHVPLKLVGTRTFSRIVKLTYEPQYRADHEQGKE